MPNERTELLMSEYNPMVAIMVYERNIDTHSDGKFYLESHSIGENGKIMEGKPLLQETIQDLLDSLYDEDVINDDIKGIFPQNLLYYKRETRNRYRMVWYRPSEIRFLIHSQPLGIPSGETWVPPMIYVADGSDLSIFVLASNDRPNLNTRLYMAPFFNVNDQGDVCLGSAKVEKPKVKSYESLMKYWEDLFWLSTFTHVNGEEKLSVDITEFWKGMIASKKKMKWDEERLSLLLPFETQTLSDLL